MSRCHHCGHHHGQHTANGTIWPSCGAYIETDEQVGPWELAGP